MNDTEREPTQDQLLAMAYADGELAREDRRDFEQRLSQEPALVREVAQLKKLELLGRQVAAPEPMDYEWDRLRNDPVQRLGWGLGWSLFMLGGVGATGWMGYEILGSDMELLPKVLFGSLFLGGIALFMTTLRGRLRTLPHDPYTEIKR